MAMATLKLNKAQCKALLRVIDKNDSCHVLRGACLEADSQIVVVTNGHILVAWAPDPDALSISGEGTYIIPHDILERTHKALKVRESAVLHFDGQKITVETSGGAKLVGQCIEGSFPAWRGCVPDNFRGEPAHLNAEYVHRCNVVMDELSGLSGPGRRPVQYSGAESAAALIDRESFALIMPVRPAEPIQLERSRYGLTGARDAVAAAA